MSIQDHQGTRKYKFILPITFILMLIITTLGPIYFLKFYQFILMLCIVSIVYRQTSTVIGIVDTAYKYYKQIKRQFPAAVQTQPQQNQFKTEDLIYAFVIPNYKQDEEMLVQVISMLKDHRRAKQQYAIFLAMEDTEVGSEQKAGRIIQKFVNSFKAIEFTVHKLRPFEQRGKASNVTWCCEQMDKLFQKNGINHDNVVLVIQDADSWVSELYINLLEQKIAMSKQSKHRRIYAPFKTMVRIDYTIPMLVRVNEKMQLVAIFNSQVGISGFSFPISHYSLSYNLAKEVQFWDTVPDAIGEDYFMTEKTFWKTKCNVKCQRIHAPVNSGPLSSGKGYIADIKAKFWQIQRHMQGAADFGYNFKFFFKNIQKWKAWMMMVCLSQLRLSPLVFPIMLLSIPLDLSLDLYGYQININYMLGIFWSVILFLLVVSIEIIQRITAKYIFPTKMKTFFILEVIEFLLLVGPLSIFLVLIPTIYASFNVFRSQRQYVTAPKKKQI